MSQAQYTSDIVRLIEEQGRQQAAAADRRGAIWGGALASLGQIPAQVQQMQRQKTHDALAQQEMGLRNQELGLRTQELDQRTKAFAQELIDRKQAHDDQAISQAGSFIHESGNTVEGLQSALAGLQKAGLLSEAEAQPILAGAQQDPTRVKSLALGMMSRTKEGRDRIEKTTTVKAGDTVLGFEGKPVFTAPPEAPKTAAEIAMAAQDPSLPQTERAQGALTAIQAPTEQARAETARHNAEMERIATLTQGRQAAASAEQARHNRADEAIAGKRAAGEDAAPTLTPQGLDITAENYAKTGQLPPMGMGKAGTAVREKIINRAAELHPDLDLAANRAGYGSDAASLKKLQAQRDAIGAFEQTASKNIDMFLDTAGKVVDTGSPLANTFIRAASAKLLGSPDQAKYDAARQVAVNEIAKITTNPNLSGALSDNARHEVEAYNPNSATLKQTVAVMRLLKQDMDNRTKAMDEQIAQIKSRVGGAKAEPGQTERKQIRYDSNGNIIK